MLRSAVRESLEVTPATPLVDIPKRSKRESSHDGDNPNFSALENSTIHSGDIDEGELLETMTVLERQTLVRQLEVAERQNKVLQERLKEAKMFNVAYKKERDVANDRSAVAEERVRGGAVLEGVEDPAAGAREFGCRRRHSRRPRKKTCKLRSSSNATRAGQLQRRMRQAAPNQRQPREEISPSKNGACKREREAGRRGGSGTTL